MNTTLFGAQAADACGAGVLAAKRPVLIVFDLRRAVGFLQRPQRGRGLSDHGDRA